MSKMLTNAYKLYVLGVLTLVYAVTTFDGALISMLMQVIKEDLALTDTQVGLVSGMAFAIFYITMGVPLARWADRGNRVTIITILMAFGGLVAGAYFFVAGFASLMLVRIFQGASDAGGRTLTYSLIGDFFPEARERSRALYFWWLAQPATGILIPIVGGWSAERFGWRWPFLVIGLAGIALALLVKFTLVDPRRSPQQAAAKPADRVMPFKDVVAFLWKRKTCRYIGLAIILLYLVGYGALSWKSAFLMRTYDVGPAQLGFWMGLINGFAVIPSMAMGGVVVDRWLNGNERGQLRLAALTIALGAPLITFYLMAPTFHVALVGELLLSVTFGIFSATPYVLLQRLVPDEMRATSLATITLFANLIGMGLGPLMVGRLSDALAPTLGNDSLRWSMLTGAPVWLLVGYFFLLASRSVANDLDTAAAEAAQATAS